MGFERLLGNEGVKKVLRNEIAVNKSSGTYLFYGPKELNKLDFAYGFAKGLICPEIEDDFCDECKLCKSINKGSYPDIELVEPDDGWIKIDRIREVIKNASSTSYSGNRKVIIITDINSVRTEAANALLKTIEEPSEGTFFILLSGDLNILPTIKSRSIKIKFNPITPREIGVSKEEYEFFEGNVNDIIAYKDIDYNINERLDYKEISGKIEQYLENPEIIVKADIIKCVLDYLDKKDYMQELEKLEFAESIEKVVGKENRSFVKELLKIFTKKTDQYEKISELFKIYSSISYNLNIPLVLYNFFLEL